MDDKSEQRYLDETGNQLWSQTEDRFIGFLHKVIRLAVKVLLALMVAVIAWGICDVIYVLYQRFVEPPFLLLNINNILATFGAFLAVLIETQIAAFSRSFGKICKASTPAHAPHLHPCRRRKSWLILTCS